MYKKNTRRAVHCPSRIFYWSFFLFLSDGNPADSFFPVWTGRSDRRGPFLTCKHEHSRLGILKWYDSWIWHCYLHKICRRIFRQDRYTQKIFVGWSPIRFIRKYHRRFIELHRSRLYIFRHNRYYIAVAAKPFALRIIRAHCVQITLSFF